MKNTEQTLNSLAGIQRAEAPAFFYTRLMAKIDAGQVGRSGSIFFRPVFSLVTLLLLLVLNIGAITYFMRSVDQPVQEENGIQSLASEMSRDLSTVYTEKPMQK